MAKVERKYAEIIAPVEEAKNLFDYLQVRSVMEVKKLDEIEGLDYFETGPVVASIEKYLDTAQTALEIIDKYAPAKSGLLDSLKGLPELSESEYLKKSDEADEILGICLKICNAEKEINEDKALISRSQAAIDAVESWLKLDIPMQFKGTDTTKAIIGTLPDEYTAEKLQIALAAFLEGEDRYECEIISHAADRSCVFVLAHNEAYETVLSA